MSPGGLSYVFEEAAQSIRRNGLMSVAALTTVTISLTVLGCAVLALFHLDRYASAQPRQFEIVAFMRQDAARDAAVSVQGRVGALAGVRRVTLVGKEQALAEMRAADAGEGSAIADALEGENPFPDRLDIGLSDPSRSAGVAAALRDHGAFPEVEAVRDDRVTLDRLIGLSRLIRNIGGAVAILLFLATAMVIQNTIRLTVAARRREIRIMQLVGATPGFIRLPMVLEGIFYGAAGAVIASGVVIFVFTQVAMYVRRFESPLAALMPDAARPFGAVGPGVVLGAMAATGAVLGLLSSLASIRRFLRRV